MFTWLYHRIFPMMSSKYCLLIGWPQSESGRSLRLLQRNGKTVVKHGKLKILNRLTFQAGQGSVRLSVENNRNLPWLPQFLRLIFQNCCICLILAQLKIFLIFKIDLITFGHGVNKTSSKCWKCVNNGVHSEIYFGQNPYIGFYCFKFYHNLCRIIQKPFPLTLQCSNVFLPHYEPFPNEFLICIISNATRAHSSIGAPSPITPNWIISSISNRSIISFL